jgi:NDP-sugar pyrophosphorylase family protein
MLKLISNNEFPKVYTYRGQWLDIGRPDDYEKASDIYTKFFS